MDPSFCSSSFSNVGSYKLCLIECRCVLLQHGSHWLNQKAQLLGCSVDLEGDRLSAHTVDECFFLE